MSKTKSIPQVGHAMGLYDSDTNAILHADNVLDIGNGLVVLYCNAKRGRIAQLCRLYDKGKVGSSVHYFVDEWTSNGLASDIVFQRFVKVNDQDPLDVAIKVIVNA